MVGVTVDVKVAVTVELSVGVEVWVTDRVGVVLGV